MWTQIAVLAIGAVLTAGAAFWALSAYRRAGGGVRSPLPALAVCGAVAVAALGAYLFIGRPELPDAPYAARLEALKDRDPRSYTVDEALAILNEAAREDTNDPLPYFYTGQLLLDQGRAEEAARAFDMALRREPQMAEALLGLGRSIVGVEGRVTPEALAAFQQASALTNDPAPWIYQAMAAMEEGRDARPLWGEAYARMNADDPRREMARRMSAGEGAE
ncbi:MAG: tetratricopeptide repeat protein [Hyphomonadaceae bacterium JAD_PAG50586_4]|nr:MAG: tetratricopeptide repeat protein [Hyphomonadaceae bacterium JAD_PAG50586_4]